MFSDRTAFLPIDFSFAAPPFNQVFIPSPPPSKVHWPVHRSTSLSSLVVEDNSIRRIFTPPPYAGPFFPKLSQNVPWSPFFLSNAAPRRFPVPNRLDDAEGPSSPHPLFPSPAVNDEQNPFLPFFRPVAEGVAGGRDCPPSHFAGS